MLVLRLADAGNTSSLGPAAALGVFCAMIAGLTLLPALLTIFGRRGFWPRRGVVEYDPNHRPDERVGAWRRFGDKVLRRPAMALTITVSVFVAGALGIWPTRSTTRRPPSSRTRSTRGGLQGPG